jgi:galactokinase
MSTDLSVATDFAAHIARLRTLPQHADPSLRTLFDHETPIHMARAPGRLDIMGGIGDYSGSLVLELPIAEAAFTAVQVTQDPNVIIASLRTGAKTQTLAKTITSPEWNALQANTFEFARALFAKDPNSTWAAYIAGPVVTLLRDIQSNFTGGLRILIDSAVPEGKGVSSSAAIEVATMRAFAAAVKIDVPGERLARLCQLAENHIVGAPCGIMDQMTSALARENELLALRCQPAIIDGFVPIPTEIAFWAIDSGVRHSVGGSDYSSVRCGAFMGYRIIADAAGLPVKTAAGGPHVIEVDDPIWNGYLANITPREFQIRFANLIPTQITGRDFTERYTGTTDRVTRIDPARAYAVRAPTLHPIEENERAHRFRTLLQNPINEKSLREMAQLMSAAHSSYTACGLASSATDLIVNLVHESGPSSGLYGAKITGGGSGGAVTILARAGADNAVAAVARRYTELTGRQSYIFCGSSPGAYSTPVQQIVI